MSDGAHRIAEPPEVVPAAGPVDVNRPEVLWADFREAVGAITIVRAGQDRSQSRVDRSALFYPLIGLMIGAILVAFDRTLVPVLGQDLTNVFLLAVLAVLSAGRHLDGFGNTADGLIGVRGRDDALATMRDRPLGTFGTAAIFFLLILKLRSFDLLADEPRMLGLLLAPMIGRWAMVVLAHGSREAGPVGAPTKFARDVGSREFAVASVFTMAVLFSLADALGLVVAIAVASLTVGLRIYLHRRLGGITDQSLGAVVEAAETLTLIVFALASS